MTTVCVFGIASMAQRVGGEIKEYDAELDMRIGCCLLFGTRH